MKYVWREMAFKSLLLNPPSPGKPVLRDFYCGTTSKAGYYWPPIDLIAQSGYLAKLGEVSLLEASAKPHPYQSTLEKAVALRPDFVLSLIGTPSLKEDLEFLRVLKEKTGARVVVSGEPALVWDDLWWEQFPWVDAVLGDFTSPDLYYWLNGESANPGLSIPGQPRPKVRRTNLASYPMPLHHLFLKEPYRHPFLGRGDLGTLLMSFGCPYRCAYCNSGFDSLGFGRRSVEEILDESEVLRAAGARKLFIKDMSFGADAHLADQVLMGWERKKISWPWVAYVRLDLLQDGLLERMAKSGCVGIQTGLEAFDISEIASATRNQNREKTEFQLHRAVELGLKIGGHFVLGLPGQSAQSIAMTISWAKKLPLSYASFNAYTPRYGTPLEKSHSSESQIIFSQSRDSSHGGLGQELQAIRLQNQANRAFYLRPKQAITAAKMWARMKFGLKL